MTAIKQTFIAIIVLASCHSGDSIDKNHTSDSVTLIKKVLTDSTYFLNDYFSNGKIKSSSYFVNGKQDSVQFYFLDDGTKIAEMRFVKGIRQGITREFHKSGQLAFEGVCVNGEFEGRSTWYFATGQINFTGNRHLGKNTGYWEYFKENGGRLKAALYNPNKEPIYYDSLGKIISSSTWDSLEVLLKYY